MLPRLSLTSDRLTWGMFDILLLLLKIGRLNMTEQVTRLKVSAVTTKQTLRSWL